MNYLIDLNILFDYYNNKRRELFPHSVEAIEVLLKNDNYNAYISSSSIDNLEFIKAQELKRTFGFASKIVLEEFIKEILSKFKIAKTPSYLEIDYKDIEDSQVIASARAVNAKLITRDHRILETYTDIAITAEYFLENQEQQNIDFANLKKQYFMYEPKLEIEIDKVLNNSAYIMGNAVQELEANLQTFTGAKHAITCSSGTDALLLAMMALDIEPDDEIITTPFTFIATAETIAFLKAKPVFVDIDEKTYNIDPSKIEEKITSKTKAIMPVSLYGQPADMDAIEAIAKKHNLKVIVDGAQSFGSTFNGKRDSSLGDISTTSFFPAKPLGCFGDGGAVFTNDDALAQKMKSLRVHGQSKRYHHQYIGMGGRMDTIQCAIVDVKLKHYEKDLALRQEVAGKYTKALENKGLILPFVDQRATSAWAQYSVRVKNRDEVQAKLKEQGIPTAVHYPMPLHLQECFAYLGYEKGDFPVAERVSEEIMSLPMNPYLGDDEIKYISKNIKTLNQKISI
jgi:UDP-2-acetamido-2-deoxy-ribo-hexuluronate aminotransferase